MSDKDLDEFIDGEIRKTRIVIFSKLTCRFSIKAKRILERLKYTFNAVELDEMGETGMALQEKLMSRTGQLTVPNIFLGGEHLGGCEELEILEAAGVLEEVLDGSLSKDTKFDFDVVVIGGGSAGLSAAVECTYRGSKVCVVNYVKPSPRGTTWGLGGTCTNVGCVPKKLLHRAAILGSDLRDAPIYGWSMPEHLELEHDWSKLVSNIQEYIESVNWSIKKDLVANGITYVNAVASLISNHNVKLTSNDSEQSISARNVVLAVGGRPRYLEFPGAEECITSDDLFSLKEFPGRTLIIGGSYVALEVASFLNSLKAEVTVAVRSKILSSMLFDKDMVQSLETEMAREGVRFIHNCAVIKVAKTSETSYQVDSVVDENTPFEEQYNTVILAVGRIPSTEDLNLSNAGIKVCGNSKIPVNEMDQTITKNIFAIGDCVNGRPELSSSAMLAGKLFAKRLHTKKCTCTIDYRSIPTCVFTLPEYACCGASELTATKLYGQNYIRVYVSKITPLEQAITEPAAKCSAKLITVMDHNKTEKIAGFHIVGPNASEIIQGFCLALRVGASKKDLDCFVGIHPTCAEIFTSMKLKGDEAPNKC